MNAHRFDCQGSSFFLLTATHSDGQKLISLPYDNFCVLVAYPPTANYLHSKGMYGANKVDCQNVAEWLAANWDAL